jgi:hypothetical protein
MGEAEVVIGAGGHPGGQGVMLLLEFAAAGGVQDNPRFRCVAEPAAVLFQDFRIGGVMPAGGGGIRGLLEFQQRVDGLLCPDHVVRGAGLGDRDQLAQQMSIAKSVRGHAVVAVVGLPGVVAGDPGERRQHPGGVHPLGPALRVDGDQHVPAGRGGVRPGQLSRHPEPGLIEVRDLRDDESRPDGVRCRGDQPGDLLRHRGQRARRWRAAEHVRYRGAGPVPGQELPVPQVGAQRRRPRPVLHRRGHPAGRAPPGPRSAAAALQFNDLVLGDLGPHRRDLGHLTPLYPGLFRPVQAPAARAAASRHMPDHAVRMVRQLHRHARLSLRAARPAAGLPPQRLRRRLTQPVRGRRLRGVLRVLSHPGCQVSDLLLKLRHLCPQPGDLRIPLRQ